MFFNVHPTPKGFLFFPIWRAYVSDECFNHNLAVVTSYVFWFLNWFPFFQTPAWKHHISPSLRSTLTIPWIYPRPSNSHHQDFYIFRLRNPGLNPYLPLASWLRGGSKLYLILIPPNISSREWGGQTNAPETAVIWENPGPDRGAILGCPWSRITGLFHPYKGRL